jgi:DNA polymerase III subunit epsilon
VSAAISHISSAALAGRYACVDLETTGADPQFARVIEVGIVLIDDGVIVDRWESLVDPERPISARVQEVTGITDDMVKGAPTFVQLLDDIAERCRDRVFAAHNARFDHGFLRAEFARVGKAFQASALCTVKLSRRLEPEARAHNLDAVIERYGLACSVRHRALPDAQAVADFLLAACHSHGNERVQAEIDRQLKTISLPPQLPASLLDDIPEGAGAFRYLDAAGCVLHIGRATRVRASVLAQLGSEHNKASARLRERIAHLEWRAASSEWSAHLQELLWRQQTRSEERYTLRLRNRGEEPVVQALRGDCLEDCYGEFRTEALANRVLQQLARRHGLCLRLLGVETGEGSCVAHQLNRCRGACIGKESYIAHDLRVQIAFADQAFRAWPFPGRVVFTEARTGSGAAHVFERWCYLGTAADEDAVCELMNARAVLQFDSRIYRLTLNALEQGRIRPRQWHTTS